MFCFQTDRPFSKMYRFKYESRTETESKQPNWMALFQKPSYCLEISHLSCGETQHSRAVVLFKKWQTFQWELRFSDVLSTVKIFSGELLWQEIRISHAVHVIWMEMFSMSVRLKKRDIPFKQDRAGSQWTSPHSQSVLILSLNSNVSADIQENL